MMRLARLSLRGGWLALALSGAASAQPKLSPRETIDRARELQAAGQGDAARDQLREAMETHPAEELLVLARAESYLLDDNQFWALKVLQDFVEERPPACEARTFIARIHLDQAHLEQAEEILERPGCDQVPEIRARKLLLRAAMAEARGDKDTARELMLEARGITPRYEEDEDLLEWLAGKYDPDRRPLLSWNLDLAAGYTSNGLAGSPVDVEAPTGRTGSAILTTDLFLHLVVPTAIPVRPQAELQLRLTELLSGDSSLRDLSTRQPTVRLGALFGHGPPRLSVSYAYDFVQVEAGDQYDDGPLLYSEAHRGEYQLEATDSWFAFGGAGYRRFRELGRSRFELEQGLATAIGLSEAVSLMPGLSMRVYDARNDAYDAVGGTALARLNVAVPGGWELRGMLSLSGDVYPDSAGYFRGSDGQDREETLLKASPELWTPSWAGLRARLGYEYSRRDSRAEAYSYRDHRVLLHVVWNGDSDQLATSLLPAEGRVPLRHGVESAGRGAGSSREIREMMRQDDAVQRGSSCLK